MTHPVYTPGESCPHCQGGKLYRLGRWSPVVRLVGQAPVGGTCYSLERLRCHLCGAVETAPLPEEAGQEKFDASVASTVAVLHCGFGMPFHRLEKMQQSAGVPLPASTQWEVLAQAAERGPRIAFEQLLELAAQGERIHNDDTNMTVLELTARKKANQPVHPTDPKRKGVFTTSILSQAAGRPTIALFLTGPYHAGENLRQLLQKRQTDLPPPIQMCDSLSHNLPGEFETLLASCLSHGRRKFYDLAAQFPKEVLHVLRSLRPVYRADALARRFGLSPQKRLILHQRRSQPIMTDLRAWLEQQFDQRLVEPNSSLGEAIRFLLKHWDELTLFLRVPGAPLDNNICERAIKLAIRFRKNSLFYKTLRGASVGDIYMSLIHTCQHAAVDAFDYLTQLQRHHHRVRQAPADWLPWTYRQTLASLQPGPNPSRQPA